MGFNNESSAIAGVITCSRTVSSFGYDFFSSTTPFYAIAGVFTSNIMEDSPKYMGISSILPYLRDESLKMIGMTKYFPHFFTATILEWKHLLRNDRYKHIITSSLQFLSEKERVTIYGFVLMSNHIHLIWHIAERHERHHVQRDFLKFTAQKIKADLKINDAQGLEHFRVVARDREYQIWERNPLSIEIYSQEVLLQKLNYMHQNPVRAGICKMSYNYLYSSALFYEKGKKDWPFLRHYLE